MKERSTLTVAEILNRKHFESALIVAGKQGIHRNVKWVHVVEVTNIKNLLNGQELILSTGVAWKENESSFYSVVEQLIDHHAAGLCIEMDTYMSNIPTEVIQLANEHLFPIIIFQDEVPFVEITQDIHSLIINQQYQMISNLENYSQNLNKRLLSIDSYNDILQFVFSSLDMQIIFKIKNHDFEFVPEISLQEQEKIIHHLENENINHSSLFAMAPIHLFGQEYAELYIYSKEIPISEYELLIMDRTSTALAQHLLRDLYVGEKKKAEEYEWLSGWLEGEHSNENIQEYLLIQGMKNIPTHGVVLIAKYPTIKDTISKDVTFVKLFFRSIFEQQGFSVFVMEKRNELIFILLNNRNSSSLKERLRKAIDNIKESDFVKKQKTTTLIIGAGMKVKQLTDIHKSYQTAKETLRIQQKLITKEIHYFYEDLHLYRIISLMNKHIDLKEIVKEYLQPVIDYDSKYNGKLLETLKAYLECNGSKQETSKKLYIVRQTLYHRLQKLENLLGDDFMQQEKRVAIEFMILVNDYMTPNNQIIGMKRIMK
ncbi:MULTISPECIES: PucR family transcriptional regulator [Bacillus]|uniref:PucR family transcriptional regulator n=1 Tax=Bacillus TaxID=1386 RepID=UPI0003169BC0|nr:MULTISPECIES: PucR family transcriptional regulator [Bacillus]